MTLAPPRLPATPAVAKQGRGEWSLPTRTLGVLVAFRLALVWDTASDRWTGTVLGCHFHFVTWKMQEGIQVWGWGVERGRPPRRLWERPQITRAHASMYPPTLAGWGLLRITWGCYPSGQQAQKILRELARGLEGSSQTFPKTAQRKGE